MMGRGSWCLLWIQFITEAYKILHDTDTPVEYTAAQVADFSRKYLGYVVADPYLAPEVSTNNNDTQDAPSKFSEQVAQLNTRVQAGISWQMDQKLRWPHGSQTSHWQCRQGHVSL